MTRDETTDLLRIRQTRTGENFGAAMLDEWTDALRDTDYGAAIVAMRRACTKHAKVNWYQFHEELAAHLRDRRDRHAEHAEALDCDLCGGTGWQYAGRDRRGNPTVEPCERHMRSGPVIAPSAGIPIAARACRDEMRRRGADDATIDERLVAVFRMSLADLDLPAYMQRPHQPATTAAVLDTVANLLHDNER